MLGFELPNSRPDLIGVTLAPLIGETSGLGAIVSLKVNGKVAKNAERQFSDFPPDLHRHIENEKTVDTDLVCAEGVIIGKRWIAAYVMTIKGIAISGIVIERRGHLRVKVVRKSEPRAYLPS